MAFFMFGKMGKAPLSRTLREIKQLFCEQSLFLYYLKQIDSMIKTSVTHSAIASCATFLFLPILTSFVIYYWKDARQHGIYLLNRSWENVADVVIKYEERI